MFWQGDGIFASLRSVDVNLVAATNPASLYFRNIFEVFVCNFIVGLAIVCQPHILSKALYLKEDRQVKQYLSVAILTGVIFVGVMVVGLYARVLFMPLNTVDAAYSFITGSSIIPMDHVVPTFIAFNFSPFVSVIIGIGVLCAGLSTLEGILLALSAIISNDLYLPIKGSISAKKDAQTDGGRDQSVLALRFARLVMIGVAIVTILISFRQLAAPTGGSVAIFAQYGVYLLFTVSFLPLACGMFFPSVPRSVVSTSVFTALTVYLLVANLGITHMHNNPAFLATVSIIAGWLVIAFGSKLSKR
jgi:Na+/pantothenate symporter